MEMEEVVASIVRQLNDAIGVIACNYKFQVQPSFQAKDRIQIAGVHCGTAMECGSSPCSLQHRTIL